MYLKFSFLFLISQFLIPLLRAAEAEMRMELEEHKKLLRVSDHLRKVTGELKAFTEDLKMVTEIFKDGTKKITQLQEPTDELKSAIEEFKGITPYTQYMAEDFSMHTQMVEQ